MKDTAASEDPSAQSSRLRSLVRTALLVLLSAVAVQWTLFPSSRTTYLWSNIKNIHRPIQYHGQGISSSFFEGWYFKLVKPGKSETDPVLGMAVIPGIYRPPPGDASHGRAHAFVILLGLPGSHNSAYYRFHTEDFVDLGGRSPGEEGAFRIKIGKSVFAHDEIILNLPAENFDHIPASELETFYTEASHQYQTQYLVSTQSPDEQISQAFFRKQFPSSDQLRQQEQQGPFAVQGHFLFPAKTQTPLPTSLLTPSIMGFTAYIPFLECNHGVASLHHSIQKGRIATLSADNSTQAEATFDGGVGYTEKDWGINFPSTWIWAQANIFKESPGSSLLVSAASVPVLGPEVTDWVNTYLKVASPLTTAPGMLFVYYHAATKTLYNFSSYILSAKVKSLKVTFDTRQLSQTVSLHATTKDPKNAHNTVAIQVNVTRAIGTGVPLRAPSRLKGRMFTAVEETVVAHTQVKLWHVHSGEVIVEDVGLGSGLEVVGDIQWLQTKFRHP